MNQRVKQLYKKARGLTLSTNDFVLEEWEKKFAELIVKECVEKLKETKEVELPLLQAINENIKELPLAVYIVELKGHFGVEHDAC